MSESKCPFDFVEFNWTSMQLNGFSYAVRHENYLIAKGRLRTIASWFNAIFFHLYKKGQARGQSDPEKSGATPEMTRGQSWPSRPYDPAGQMSFLWIRCSFRRNRRVNSSKFRNSNSRSFSWYSKQKISEMPGGQRQVVHFLLHRFHPPIDLAIRLGCTLLWNNIEILILKRPPITVMMMMMASMVTMVGDASLLLSREKKGLKIN